MSGKPEAPKRPEWLQDLVNRGSVTVPSKYKLPPGFKSEFKAVKTKSDTHLKAPPAKVPEVVEAPPEPEKFFLRPEFCLISSAISFWQGFNAGLQAQILHYGTGCVFFICSFFAPIPLKTVIKAVLINFASSAAFMFCLHSLDRVSPDLEGTASRPASGL